ncbi:aldo/keto reductase [Fructilactobacillus myrtifloralis]|uniref:Aldo/keto reductase n=1 Tax=Fructilactobacillus myrtifloralis TaxID=2940301 RepID=A0ABY5BLE6_9LACO|nr:aldo/keto reductase [Fructilactobacillus myrtifloralis]USS84495.1 aldo/keto reductase [Fructilactobacillus myrtifloralis]
MNYQTLSNNVKMPMLGFGVFQASPSETEKAVGMALATGYRLIDTAVAYQNEAAVGNAIKNSNVSRDQLFVTTKVWLQDYGYQQTQQSVFRSLELLKTDYLDLVLLHQPIGDVWGAWRALEDLYRDGTVRAIGVSNFPPELVEQFLQINEIKPMVNQIEINPFYQQTKNVSYLQSNDVVAEAWAPFAEGKNGIFHNPQLQEIANVHQTKVGNVILRWLNQRNIVTIPKSIHQNRIESNFAIFDFELSPTEMEMISSLNTDVSMFNQADRPDVARTKNLINWHVNH